MKEFAVRTFALSVSVALLLSACGQPEPETSAPATVEVSDAFCRPTQAGRDVTGCYVTLIASGDDRLVSVASPMAAEAQIHEMKMADGMMRMGELPGGLALPAGEAVALRPGGTHLMVLGLSGPLAPGDQLPITLTFQTAPPRDLNVVVSDPAE